MPHFIGEIYRPPSEAQSLLLQVTVGCSHNRCSFCAMYLAKNFQVKAWETVSADIDEYARERIHTPRLFLCDGDALVLSQDRLTQILSGIKERLPWVRRVSAYADSKSILRKSVAELRELRALGLSLVYHGVESGDDRVLAAMNKGSTVAEAVAASQRLKEAEISHSVMFLLGLGGVEGARDHALLSGEALTKIDPQFASALTLSVVPGTPLAHRVAKGDFVLPSPFALLQELYWLIESSSLSQCAFAANHASNYLPLKGRLPTDKEKILRVLEMEIKRGDRGRLVPEWLRGL